VQKDIQAERHAEDRVGRSSISGFGVPNHLLDASRLGGAFLNLRVPHPCRFLRGWGFSLTTSDMFMKGPYTAIGSTNSAFSFHLHVTPISFT
jgi:hypothetical protein